MNKPRPIWSHNIMLKPILTLLATLLAVLPAVPAAAPNLPTMGDPAARAMTTEQEAAIGRHIMRDLRAHGYVLDDPAATEYLQSLGQRLASHSSTADRRFTFFWVNDPAVNAFALPGGYIGINAGMIMMTQSESELAGVVAHEIAHVTQRHLARQIDQASRMGIVSAATMLAAVLVGVATGESAIIEAGMATAAGAQMQSRINYTRSHEHEADRVGIATLAAAGFDPEAVGTLWEQIERRARQSGAGSIPEFLRTHPVTTTRITEARERAARYGSVTPDESRAYRLMRARIRALATPSHDAVDYFRATLKTAPDVEREALTYGLALALTDVGRAREAIDLLEPLAAANADVMYYHLALASAEFMAGELEAAIARYETAMRLFPRSAAVTQAYAHALIYDGRGREALPHLISLLPQSNPNPQLYRLLAMASGSSGELADAHYFMAEAHVVGGQLFPAIDQLQLALSIPGITQQQRSRAEARLEQLAEFLPRGQRARLDQPIPRPRQP